VDGDRDGSAEAVLVKIAFVVGGGGERYLAFDDRWASMYDEDKVV